MLIDGNTASNLPQTADFLVVGTGPAGLAVALELEAANFTVLLMEAGDLMASADSQAFYEGEVAGISYPLNASRMRMVGGSSNCWGGWCRQLEDIEFRLRPWMPNGGWPIDHASIAKYYAAAGRMLGVGGVNFDAARWASQIGRKGASLCDGSRILESRVWQVSVSKRLAEKYIAHLSASKRIFLVYNCAATQLVASDSRIAAIKYCSTTGRRGQLTARKGYIAAMGALENARLLLNSLESAKSALLGASRWMGKGFMEHPARVDGWRLYAPLRKTTYREQDGLSPSDVPGQSFKVAFGFGLNRATQQKYQLPGLWAVAGQAKPISDEFERRKANSLLQSMLGSSEEFNVGAIDITWAIEQSVNVNSKVEVTNSLDPMGVPKLSLTWKISDFDSNSVRTTERLIAEDFVKRKIGRMRLLKTFRTDDKNLDYGNHHMGTTRMAHSAKDGVVDTECKVFGTRNLFIAGSGVFPSSAATNPTLALTAVAMRLADHLKKHQ